LGFDCLPSPEGYVAVLSHPQLSTIARVEALGSEMVDKLTYYERWIVAFADILFQKQILTPEELARKMDEVAARHAKPTETCRTTAAG
jgi:hypothetical protein